MVVWDGSGWDYEIERCAHRRHFELGCLLQFSSFLSYFREHSYRHIDREMVRDGEIRSE